MTRLGLTAAVLAAIALLCSSSANASLITVNAGPNGTTFATITTGAPPVVGYSGSSGPFIIVTGSSAQATGAPGTTSFSSSNISFQGLTGGPSTLIVWITLQGLTAPATGKVLVQSGLTANDLVGVPSATLLTFLDPTNGVSPPNGAHLLANATFTAPGAVDIFSAASTGPGPYSLQEVYKFTTNGAPLDNVNLTIDLTTVATVIPEPTTLALLGSGLLVGIGLLRRRG